MTKFGQVDSYRSNHTCGGFTWGRNNTVYIRSRLDMILISKQEVQNLTNVSIDYNLNESDHN
jgi:hypothetical protein